MMYEIIRGEFERSSIFKDESKLYPDYVPEYLPHREEQLRHLARSFRVILEKPGTVSQKVIITGPVGTGKTAVSKRFGVILSEYAKKKGINLHYIHVNCHKDRTLFLIMRRVSEAICPAIPKRGLSAAEMMHMVKSILEEKNEIALITLDEVNYLISTSGGDALYDLIRISEEDVHSRHRFNYILIMRDLSCLPALDPSITSSLMHNIIRFKPYTSSQIMDILNQRVEEAFYPNVVSPEALRLIADIAGFDSGGPGDARYALELLLKAGEYAEKDYSKRVTPDHVRRAKRRIHPSLRIEDIEALGMHEKILLLAIARSLKKTEQAYISLGAAEKEYHLVCEELGERPRRHTQVWEYVQNMRRLGIIATRISGPGQRGRTTLISLPDVPTDIVERSLLEMLKRGVK